VNTRPWTSKELAELRRHRELGAVEIASHLGRSVGSVPAAAYRQRVTLRRPGERGGHLLGQARSASLPAEERERAIADPVFLQRAAAARGGALCPDCGRRPVEIITTGFCGVCSTRFIDRLARDRGYELDTAREVLNMLADLHGASLVAGHLDRALVAARQRRHRDRLKRQSCAGAS
jgi:hypothetical protein